MLDKTKTLTKWTRQTGKEPYENHSEKNRALQNAKMNKTKKKSSDRKGPAKSSKKQHLENCGIFVKQVVFHTVNHCGPLPLKELHSTGETIVWRDPGGSLACLPPVYDCVWNHPATVRDTCGIHPKQHTKKRGVIRNTKRPKSQEEELGCG